MIETNAQKEIARLQRQIAKLESRVAKEAARRLAKGRRKVTLLARQLGYQTPQELIAALFGSAVKSAPKAAPLRARKRARISDADRKAIVADLKSGKLTAVAVAKKHGVSVPTVALIKRKAGLTKNRSAPTKRTPRAARPAVQAPAPATAEQK